MSTEHILSAIQVLQSASREELLAALTQNLGLSIATPQRRRSERAAPSGGTTKIIEEQVVGCVLESHEPISAGEIARQLNANPLVVGRHLRSAVYAGKIARQGKARGTTYAPIEITKPAEVAPPETPSAEERGVVKRRKK